MTEATYSVTGMTCDHCVRAVDAEVGKIAGVASVSVDLRDRQETRPSLLAIHGRGGAYKRVSEPMHE